MQELRLKQKNTQKLTKNQIRFMQMLQISAADMQQRVLEELIENPALAKEVDEPLIEEEAVPVFYTSKNNTHNISSQEFIQHQVAHMPSIQEQLLQQLQFLSLTSKERLIASHLINSLTVEGYLPSSSEKIIAEIAIVYYEEVTKEEIESVRQQIQQIGPPGITAYNLRECLLLQLGRKPQTQSIAQAIVVLRDHFEAFKKKHYEKIGHKLKLSSRELHPILHEITQLRRCTINLGPSETSSRILEPDFIITTHNNKTSIQSLNKRLPRLTVNKDYHQLLQQHQKSPLAKSKVLVTFIQEKINRAKWFMRAIEQRKRTLLLIMRTILKLQRSFFSTGDQYDLKPMFLRNVAEKINMDISTVSRAIHDKSVQCHGQVLPLSYFFSESIPMQSGGNVSSRVIKQLIKELIAQEHKHNPHTDTQLTVILQGKGFLIARRTIAKYRQQLGIPVARLRKELFA